MESTAQPTYLSYLVRLWRDYPEAPWRASLESIATGEIRRFGGPDQMWTFLQTQLEGGDPVPGEPPTEGAA